MTTSLFRSEAIAHQQEARMGDVMALRTSSLLWLSALFALFALALVLFLAQGEYTRKARVTGFLAPTQGMVKIFTPQAGTVVERKVEEGQTVQQGDVLFVLSAEQSSLESADTQASVITSLQTRRDSLLNELEQQDELHRVQWQDLHDNVNALQQELLQLEQEIVLQQQRVAVANGTLEKFHDLYKKHYVSQLQWQEKRDELLHRQATLQSLHRDRLVLQRQLQTLRADISGRQFEFARQRAELDRDISQLEQQITEYQARRSIVITAPTAGTVTAILLQKGQVAGVQSPLASILPQGSELQAHLLVPSRAIGFVSAGQAVALRYQAFPYQRFGSHAGVVSEISRTIIRPGEADFPVQLTEPAYRVVVRPAEQNLLAYQQSLPLQAGMLLDADIKLDRRSLFQWVFDPIYSLAGTL